MNQILHTAGMTLGTPGLLAGAACLLVRRATSSRSQAGIAAFLVPPGGGWGPGMPGMPGPGIPGAPCGPIGMPASIDLSTIQGKPLPHPRQHACRGPSTMHGKILLRPQAACYMGGTGAQP